MPVEKVLLVTRPNSDIANEFGNYWLGKTIVPMEADGFQVIDLDGDEANPILFTAEVLEKDPIHVWGFGHGFEEVFTGQNSLILLQKGINEKLMSGRIVHLTSCLTGSAGGLCESLYNNGAVAVIGYNVDFIIGVNTEYIELTPDNVATTSLMKPDIAIQQGLIDGDAVVDAFIEGDDLSEQEIEKWRISNHPDADLLIWCHINNMNGKVLYGIGSAQVRPQAPPINLATIGIFGSAVIIASALVVKSKGEKRYGK